MFRPVLNRVIWGIVCICISGVSAARLLCFRLMCLPCVDKWLTGIHTESMIDVQYRQSESDGQIHQTSFTMDPMEFFF